MFLKKYLTDFNYNLLISTYDEVFLNTIDEETFLKNYNTLLNYGFSFIEDIIVNYLDLFIQDDQIFKSKLDNLINHLGDNYLDIISNNLSLLNKLY